MKIRKNFLLIFSTHEKFFICMREMRKRREKRKINKIKLIHENLFAL